MFKWLKKLFAKTAPAVSENGTGRMETEFSAEIVKVTQVLPHPNADRLEILRFEMKGTGEASYEVISQKGTFGIGSLAAYLSSDTVVPTHLTEFSFLTERADGKGKTHYRLRAARLRGVFSQGLLVPAPEGMAFGDSVAEHFGVTYHSAPSDEPRGQSQGPSGKAPKVQPFPIYGVDSLKKNPRLFSEGEPVLVTEKIHGTNFRFGWIRRRLLGIPVGWRFVVGSHRVIKETGSRDWYGTDNYTEAAARLGLAEKTKAHRGLVFYGELYGHWSTGTKIQDLTYGRLPEEGPGLAVFDVRTPEGWMNPHARVDLVWNALGIPNVPNFGVQQYSEEYVKWLAEGNSILDGKQIREGVVVEALDGSRRKAKYVGQGYLLREDLGKAGKHVAAKFPNTDEKRRVTNVR